MTNCNKKSGNDSLTKEKEKELIQNLLSNNLEELTYIDSPWKTNYEINYLLDEKLRQKYSKIFIEKIMETFYLSYTRSYTEFWESEDFQKVILTKSLGRTLRNFEHYFSMATFRKDYDWWAYNFLKILSRFEIEYMLQKFPLKKKRGFDEDNFMSIVKLKPF